MRPKRFEEFTRTTGNVYPAGIDITAQMLSKPLVLHNFIVVITFVWVFGTLPLTQWSDIPFLFPAEVLQIVCETAGGECLKCLSLLISQANDR